MKKRTKIVTGALVLALAGSLNAQNDTTRVITDTVKVIERTKVIHDTIVRQEIVRPQTPAPVTKEEEPKLRRGEFGLRFMPTFTSLNFNTSEGGTVQGAATISYGYGVMLGANFSKNFGIVAEVNYLGISQKYKDQNLDREVNINYVNIPVMLSFNTDKTRPVNLNLVVGPQFGLNVGSSMSGTDNGNSSTVQATLAVKQGDVGIAYGGGLEFALNRMHTIRLDLGFRGMYGLVDISGGSTGPDTYNVLVNASRKSYGGYAGLTFCW